MKISKFAKVHRDVLAEYVYNDGNLISEPYKILVNIKDGINSFLSGDTSGTNNIESNQLFKIDAVSNKFGKVNPSYYSFLQTKDYSSGIPVRYDTIKLHLPVNYKFGEYIGCYLKVYTYGYDNRNLFEISNFYFDLSDVGQSYLLNYTSPPFLFQEKLWGKNLTLEIPAISEISAQRVDGRAKENSINSNLTNGLGLSLTSPIFIDFHFINKSQTLNGVTTYLLSPKTTITVPQAPEFEQLGLKIEHSVNGDFFEIFGTYNNTIAELKRFIDNSISLGNQYYIEYSITLYEQNIKGKTLRIMVNDNFTEKVEYRPIIKYSTTTAIIDVELRLVDAVDSSYTIRRASYGMLQDEVSKYSLNLSKINLRNAHKPKIYNTRTGSGFGDANSGMGSGFGRNNGDVGVVIQTVKVPFPVLIEKANIVGKSENVVFQKDKFFGVGKILISIFPFDNIINFVIADASLNKAGLTTLHYLDMSGMNDIELEFKNSFLNVKVPIYREAENNLTLGQVVFKVPHNKIPDIRKIYNEGTNIFYITTTTDDITTVIYSGLFTMYDSTAHIKDMNDQIPNNQGISGNPSIIEDPNSSTREKAIVTRKIISKGSDRPTAPRKGSTISSTAVNTTLNNNNNNTTG